MAESSNGTFVKAFLPGLIVGLVAGSLATAFLGPVLTRPDVIVPKGAAAHQPTAPREGEMRDAVPPADQAAPADGASQPDAQPKDQLPKEQPGTPATDSPKQDAAPAKDQPKEEPKAPEAPKGQPSSEKVIEPK